MKILSLTLQAVLILLLSAGPLLAQGESGESLVFENSDASAKESDPDSTYPGAGRDFLDIFETLGRAFQEGLLPSGEAEIKEKLLVPANLKNSEEKPMETEIHAVEGTMKDPPDIGEMTDKEMEASPINEETRIKRDVTGIGYVAWRKKPIGQRALELALMESDKEILDILHKEYGKAQLDQWLGVSKESKH